MSKYEIGKLYDSESCTLVDIITTGKKETNGILCFRGRRTVLGTGKVVRALEDGIVLEAGREQDIHSREHRIGVRVKIRGNKGVTITYARLAQRTVNEGDFVKAGQPIGIEGSTGTGAEDYLLLEFRRNGRRVDGLYYLGIPNKPASFTAQLPNPADVVCKVFGLTDGMRAYIDTYPQADELWKRFLGVLEPKEISDDRCIRFDKGA